MAGLGKKRKRPSQKKYNTEHGPFKGVRRRNKKWISQTV